MEDPCSRTAHTPQWSRVLLSHCHHVKNGGLKWSHVALAVVVSGGLVSKEKGKKSGGGVSVESNQSGWREEEVV